MLHYKVEPRDLKLGRGSEFILIRRAEAASGAPVPLPATPRPAALFPALPRHRLETK